MRDEIVKGYQWAEAQVDAEFIERYRKMVESYEEEEDTVSSIAP
jgi:hypothetical protein